MTLAARTVHIPAGVGIDEAVRAEHIEFGSRSLVSVNVRQTKNGALTTRLGFTALSNGLLDGSTASAGYKVFADRDTVVRITSAPQAEVYSPQAGAWQSLGRVPEAACRILDVPSVGNTTYFEDVDCCNGYVALSWVASPSAGTGVAYLAILDQATGAVVRAPEVFGGGVTLAAPLLAVQGNTFIALVYNAAVTRLDVFFLDTTSRATVQTGWVYFGSTLCNDCATSAAYSLVALPNAATPSCAVLYVNTSAGTSRATVKTFTITAGVGSVLQTLTIGTTSVTPDSVAIGGNSSDTLWCSWNEGGTVLALGLDPSNITAAAKATRGSIFTGLSGVSGIGVVAGSTVGDVRMYANDSASTPGCYFASVSTVVGVATRTTGQVRISAAHACRTPFFANGRYYSAFYVPANGGPLVNPQSSIVVCDFTDVPPGASVLRPVANTIPGLVDAGLAMRGKFAFASSTGRYLMGLGVKRSAIVTGSSICELDFASTSRWQTAHFGNSTYLSGGISSVSDGLRISEIGFLFRPLLPLTSLSGTGITGTFRYICVYEEVDADGNWTQSGLGDPSAATTPANQTVTVSTVPLNITSRPSSSVNGRKLSVAFYRTLDGGNAPYYRLGSSPNDTVTGLVSFVDATPDATLAANAKLYSQPGVLGTAQDKRPPPPFACIASYNGMLVGAFGSDVWYSGQNVSGEGVWFNPIFQVPVPGDGDITALAAMDGTLFVFKRREVWALAGDAPSDNGASGGLGVPRRLAVDVGCIDVRSLCTTALGVFFQSDRGIEILTRAQSVEWVGEPVQNTVSSFPICTSAVVDPRVANNAVLFEMASSQSSGLVTGTGRTLIYALDLKMWISTDRRTSTAGLADAPAQSGCIIRSGSAYRYAWLNAGGPVEVESDMMLDGGGNFWIQPQWETAWAKLGLQQEQMLWGGTVLFERLDAAGLKVEVAYDYQPYSSANNKVWTEGETLGQLQLEFRPKPKGQAMKFRVTGTQPAVLGTGKGISFVGLSLDIAPKQGPTKGTPRLATALRR